MNLNLPQLRDIRLPALTQALQHKLDHKTKPLGSLGRLESLALQLGEILGTDSPTLQDPQMVVFAGDHGITQRGVSAFPSDVSWQMVENFLAGGAAVSVFSRLNGIALTVVDCGVKHDFLAGLPAGSQRPGLQVRKATGAELGTADSSVQAAMSAEQCQQALAHGMALVKELPGNALLLGEMGIGNTSAASLLLARLAGLDIEVCTGAGTGLDAPAVATHRPVRRWRHWPRWAALRLPPWSGPCCRPPTSAGWCWWTALSPPRPCWWHTPYSRWCCSAVCLRTARVSADMNSCCNTWGCRRCLIWACAWAKARARRWPGRC